MSIGYFGGTDLIKPNNSKESHGGHVRRGKKKKQRGKKNHRGNEDEGGK